MHIPRVAALLALSALCGCGGAKGKAPVTSATAPLPEQTVLPAESVSESEKEFQVQGELGVISEEAVDASLQMHGAEITACYQRKAKRLWYLGGKFELKVRVLKDGAVKEITPLSPLGNYEVERCIVSIVHGVVFSKPKGNAEAEFNYAWNFQPKAALKSWSNGDVEETFGKHLPELAACEKLGNVPPGLRITFFVLPGGKVTSAGVGADGPVGDAYAQCVANLVTGWKFADPLGRARATYQF